MLNFFKKETKKIENFPEILSEFKNLEKKFQKISAELDELKKEGQFCIKKVGMIRFNPFSGVGSDLSFSIALLDGRNDGVVITSLYNREENRVYAKPIKDGQSQYSLSGEEKEVIERAKNPGLK